MSELEGFACSVQSRNISMKRYSGSFKDDLRSLNCFLSKLRQTLLLSTSWIDIGFMSTAFII